MEKVKPNLPGCDECKKYKNSVFCNLSSLARKDISLKKSTVKYKKGELLFSSGDRPKGVFCLYNGKVKISKLSESGNEYIVRMAGDSSLLGYRSFLNEEPYQASAVAMDDTEACFFYGPNFRAHLKEHPELSIETIKLLSKQLGEAEDRLTKRNELPVKDRIVLVLLQLIEKYGLEEDNTLNVKISRREIGNLASTTTESTIRSLSELQKEGLLILQARKIIIPSISLLETYVI